MEDASKASIKPLCVVKIEETGASIPEIIADLNSPKKDKVPALGSIHEAALSIRSVLDQLSDDNIKKILNRMRMEYESHSRIGSYR